MRIIKTTSLNEYAALHPRASSSLRIWKSVILSAEWTCFNDVQMTLGSADAVRLPSSRSVVVFNIGGNEFRLITAINYTAKKPKQGRVYILEFLTHAEYDKEAWKKRY